MISYTVQQVAELVGVSARTVRYYEAEGLLVPAERTAGQHRRFGVGDVLDLVRIRRMVNLGLTLEQIKTILDSPSSQAAEVVAGQLRASLDSDLATLQFKQQILNTLTSRGAPLDTLPEFADELARLRSMWITPVQQDLPRAAVELMAAIATEDTQARTKRLVNNTNQEEQPDVERLVAHLSDSTPQAEVVAIARRWGQVLIKLFDTDEDYRQYLDDQSSRAAIEDLLKQSLNDAQLRARAIAQEMLAEHRRQLVESGDQNPP